MCRRTKDVLDIYVMSFITKINTDELYQIWKETGRELEVDALRRICERNGITPLVERSRSGRGAHVWLLKKTDICCSCKKLWIPAVG